MQIINERDKIQTNERLPQKNKTSVELKPYLHLMKNIPDINVGLFLEPANIFLLILSKLNIALHLPQKNKTSAELKPYLHLMKNIPGVNVELFFEITSAFLLILLFY